MTVTAQSNHGYFEGVGRLRLHYRTWEVPAPRAALILVHGLWEHTRRYEEFAETMLGHRFSTFAFDLRGHGVSEGRRGHVARFDILLQDLDRFRREVHGLVHVGCPVFLVGHSMGGLIAIRYLEEYDPPIQGAVITSPWLGTRTRIPTWKRNLGRVLNRVLPAFPIIHRLDPRDLSHDAERVGDYRNDPLIHSRITPRMFAEVEDAGELAMRRGDRIRLPLLFLIAGDDRLIDADRARAFAASLAPDSAAIDVLPDQFHELLQEAERADTFARIRRWLLERLD